MFDDTIVQVIYIQVLLEGDEFLKYDIVNVYVFILHY